MPNELIAKTTSSRASDRSAVFRRKRNNGLRLVSGIGYSLDNTATTLSALFEGVAQPWWLFYAYLFSADGERGVQC